MARITPVNSLPANPDTVTLTNGVPNVVRLDASDGIDLISHSNMGAADVGLRPYFWVAVPGLGANNGLWAPLAGDKAGGTGSQAIQTVNSGALQGAGHMQYKGLGEGAYFAVLVESGAIADIDAVILRESARNTR